MKKAHNEVALQLAPKRRQKLIAAATNVGELTQKPTLVIVPRSETLEVQGGIDFDKWLEEFYATEDDNNCD